MNRPGKNNGVDNNGTTGQLTEADDGEFFERAPLSQHEVAAWENL